MGPANVVAKGKQDRLFLRLSFQIWPALARFGQPWPGLGTRLGPRVGPELVQTWSKLGNGSGRWQVPRESLPGRQPASHRICATSAASSRDSASREPQRQGRKLCRSANRCPIHLPPIGQAWGLGFAAFSVTARYSAAACATVGAVPATVVRRMSRGCVSS